jgi:hypothetical protein
MNGNFSFLDYNNIMKPAKPSYLDAYPGQNQFHPPCFAWSQTLQTYHIPQPVTHPAS